ncbi:hypothetical protein [Streptomyces sp. NPDC046261]
MLGIEDADLARGQVLAEPGSVTAREGGQAVGASVVTVVMD